MLWSFAKEDITPPEGLWLDGFANRPAASDGVLDPLAVRAAAVQRGRSAFVFISAEALVLTDDRAWEIRRRAAEACGLQPHRVLVAATHTHAAPMSMPTEHEEDYEGWWESVAEKAVGAAARALGTLRPARFDVQAGLMRIGVSRREFTEKGVMVGENAKAVIDRNLRLLRVVGEDGALMGALVQGACHASCLSSKNTLVSGDWPGRACLALEERNRGATFLYFNGGCGDVNPKRYAGEDDLDCLRRTVATFLEDADRLLGKPFEPHDDGGVDAAASAFDVPLKKPERSELVMGMEEWRRRMAAAPDDSWDKILGVYCGRFTENALIYLESGKPYAVRAWLQAARLAGDVAFFALPFETFSTTSRELALYLKGMGIPKQNVFTVGYANGMHGFLPTARAIREGGHEPVVGAWFYNLPAYYSPRAEKAVRNRLLALWEETAAADEPLVEK